VLFVEGVGASGSEITGACGTRRCWGGVFGHAASYPKGGIGGKEMIQGRKKGENREDTLGGQEEIRNELVGVLFCVTNRRGK